MSSNRGEVGRGARWVLATLVLYGFFTASNPFGHHDFACHQKSATHCTACTSSPLASSVEHAEHLKTWTLADAGQLHPLSTPMVDNLLTYSISGRSPPSF